MPETTPLLGLVDVHQSFLERPVLQGVTFTVHEGDRIGLLGANGAGKSTLMRIMTGDLTPDAGEVRMRRDTSVTYLQQSVELDDQATVRQWVEGAYARVQAMEDELHTIHERLGALDPHSEEASELIERQGELTVHLEKAGAYERSARIGSAMAALGLPPPDQKIGTLSGGERRRVGLCRVLLEAPDLLLLDEPTNHLDAETLEWLEEFLARYGGSVVLVTHDRYFLDRVVNRMLEIDRGQVRSYQGNYEEYLEAKDMEDELAARAEQNRRRTLRTELEWLRRQPKARTTKSKSRIKAAEDLSSQRLDIVRERASFRLPDAPHLGKTVIETEHIKKELGGRQLVDGFTFTMVPGDRIAILGRNGAGKTTLLRLLLGMEKPDAGRVHHGKNVQIIYADQRRETLDPEKTVLEEVAGDIDWLRVDGERVTVRTYLKKFLFTDEQAARPVKLLSGGERNRVLLAKILRRGGNLVALDEPTNDLDLPTLRVLEDALIDFDGSAILVSHDRYFINRVARRIFWMPGDGSVHEIVGNYDDFRRYRDWFEGEQNRKAAAQSAREAVDQPAPSPPPKRPPAVSKKLSFNEQREFDAMEERILSLEEEFEELDALLNEPGTYTDKSKEAVQALTDRRQSLRAEIDGLYERWAQLSERAR